MFKITVNNGANTTLASINFINFSFKIEQKEKQHSPEFHATEIEEQEPQLFFDYKTTLNGMQIDLIEGIKSNINVFLFIEKEKQSSSWNLVAPIIHEVETNKIYQYGLGYFAIEGSGGGLSNMKDLIRCLNKLHKKGIKVSIIPKVIDNELIHKFERFDSNLTLSTLIDKSTDLINYRKDSFIEIYRKYNEIIDQLFDK